MSSLGLHSLEVVLDETPGLNRTTKPESVLMTRTLESSGRFKAYKP